VLLLAVATTSIRSKVLGHSRADIYERYYQSQKVLEDVDSAYLGTPAREALIRTLGTMSLTRDPNAPKELNQEQLDTIEQDPELVKKCERQQSLVRLMERKFGSITKARRSELHLEYSQLCNSIKYLRQNLQRESFHIIREEYFEKIDTVLIEKELLGLSAAEEFKVDDGEQVHFTFHERARLAQNLFDSSDSKEGQDKIHIRRVQVITDWVALCSLREARNRKVIPTHSTALSPSNGFVDADIFPLMCPGTQCLFCLGDVQLPHSAKTYSFSRLDHLRRHVQDCHLKFLDPDSFTCTHPACEETLHNIPHFKDRGYFVHNVYV
jgi:hypothetical protein